MSAKPLNEILADGEKYFISLSKLTGKSIKDIEVTLSKECGSIGIKLFRVRFTDGTSAFVEGEHDHPYLDSLCGVTEEDAKRIYEEARK